MITVEMSEVMNVSTERERAVFKYSIDYGCFYLIKKTGNKIKTRR